MGIHLQKKQVLITFAQVKILTAGNMVTLLTQVKFSLLVFKQKKLFSSSSTRYDYFPTPGRKSI